MTIAGGYNIIQEPMLNNTVLPAATLSAGYLERLKNLFDSNIPHSPILFSTLEGKNVGRFIVDNFDHPEQCIALCANQLVFLSRTVHQNFLDACLECLRETVNIDLVWATTEPLLRPPLSFQREINRYEFFRENRFGENQLINQQTPRGFSIRKVDHELLGRCHWKSEVIVAYGSFEKFFQSGFGYCTTIENKIASEAYALFSGINQTEIIFFSAPEYRKKGLALLTCLQLLKDCENLGQKAYCTCDQDNKPSTALIHRLGFKEQRAYKLFRYLRRAPSPPDFKPTRSASDGQISIEEITFLSSEKIETDSSPFFADNLPLIKMSMTSDSMSPLLKVADVFSTQKIGDLDLRCGNIVLIKHRNQLFAHRFLKSLNSGFVITKGDNLSQADPLIDKSAILAKITIIRKPGYEIDLNKPIWKITNFLLGGLGIIETTGIFRKFKRPIVILTKTFIKIINPAYGRLFSDHSSEKYLVTTLSQITFDPDKISVLHELTGQALDWHYIYQLILYNNVGPIVFRNTNQLGNNFLPAWIRENLERIVQESSSANTRIFQDVARLLAACHEQGIRIILLKGLSVAQTLYGDLSLRPMKDADILVKKSDWPAFNNILNVLGFKNKGELDLLELHRLSKTPMHWHLSYINDTGTELEIKFQLYDMDFPDFSEPDYYWQNAAHFKINNTPALRLKDEDEFLHLIARMPNVRFLYLQWFDELKELLLRRKDLNWEEIVLQAKAKNIAAIAYFTLKILKDKFKSDVPFNVLEQLRPSGFKILLLNLICAKNYTGVRTPHKRESSLKFSELAAFILLRASLKPRKISGTVRYIFRLLFPPASYLSYRYKLPLWQTYLGFGYIRRFLFGFIEKRLSRVFERSKART